MDQFTSGHPLAHTGVYITIYDLLGRTVRGPIWRLLAGRIHESMRVMAPNLGYLSPAEMATEAYSYLEKGYTDHKPKSWPRFEGRYGNSRGNP